MFALKSTFTTEPLLGLKGGTLFLFLQGIHGHRPSLRIGDVQWTSNIEGFDNTFNVFELWYQQAFFDEKFSLLAGLHDLNAEFYVTPASALFIHSSFGIGLEFSQTGVNGPSVYPATALALRAKVEPTKNFYFETAVFNAVSGNPNKPRGTHIHWKDEGELLVSEMAYQRGTEENSPHLYGKYGIGAWQYTRTFDHQVDVDADENPVRVPSRGLYFIAEQAVIPQLSLFFHWGVASAEANRTRSNVVYGFLATGLIPSRDLDKFGFGITTVAQSAAGKEANPDAAKDLETAYEVFYRIEIGRGWAFQPDFQYVVNPGYSNDIPNASVGILRLEVTL